MQASRIHWQQRPYAGRQFVEIERFDQIVIGARIQTFDAVSDGVASREYQDRNSIRRTARRPQYVQPVFLGKTEIEQHEIVHGVGKRKVGCASITHPVDGEAVAAQTGAHTVADHCIILNEQ